MTSDDLRNILQAGEGPRIEFKQEAIKPSDLAETLVAFANASGGLVLIGVDDGGRPVGLRNYQQAYDLVTIAASQELCDPPVRLTGIEAVTLAAETHVLAVSVPRSRQLHAVHGRFLVRRGSRNVALTTAEVAVRTRRFETGGLAPLQLSGGYRALYEVLAFDACLELLDAHGRDAVLSREQEVRFLQDGVVGFHDQAWGDGQLFADYDIEPGVVADRFQIGPRQITLISLREIKNRGDRLRFRVRRRVRDGWTETQEWLETTVNHRTRSLRVRVIFPADRPPREASVVAESSGSVTELDRQHWQVDAQGRCVIIWEKRRPTQGETYLLRWTW